MFSDLFGWFLLLFFFLLFVLVVLFFLPSLKKKKKIPGEQEDLWSDKDDQKQIQVS